MSEVKDSDAESIPQEQIEQFSYEDGYARLQQILEALEEDDLPLEKALALYETGTRLVSHCMDRLESAELRVREWRQDSDARPFDDWQAS